MEKITKFDFPTQVIFYDFEHGEWAGGIAYGTKIICGCCGGIFEIEEVNNIEVLPWIDISSEIIGE